MIQKTSPPLWVDRAASMKTDSAGKGDSGVLVKGYDGATIDDLVAGMGVGRPSLYAVFGDKRTLFLRVLKDYAQRERRSRREGAAVAADASRLA